MSREQQLFDALEGALSLIDMDKAPDWFVIMARAARSANPPACVPPACSAEMFCFLNRCKTVESCAGGGCANPAPKQGDAKDAERYRWLTYAGWIDDAIMAEHGIKEGISETLDSAIDAAILASKATAAVEGK